MATVASFKKWLSRILWVGIIVGVAKQALSTSVQWLLCASTIDFHATSRLDQTFLTANSIVAYHQVDITPNFSPKV